MHRKLTAGALALLVGTGIASSQTAEKVALKRAFKPGVVTTYNWRVKLEAAGGGDPSQAIDVTLASKESVLKVLDTGGATIKVELSGFRVKIGGQEFDPAEAGAFEPPVLTKHYSPDGRITKIEINTENQYSAQFKDMLQSTRLSYPAKAVGVGDKWDYEYKPEKDSESQSGYKTSFEVLAMEKLAGSDTAKVKIHSEVTSGEQVGTKLDGTVWIDRVSGDIVRMIGTSKDIDSPMGYKADLSITLDRTSVKDPTVTKPVDKADASGAGATQAAAAKGEKATTTAKEAPLITEP